MKTELIEKFKTLLQTDDITSIQDEARDLMSSYNQQTAQEKREQDEAWNKEEHEEGEEFEFQPNVVDEAFEALAEDFRGRVRAWKDEIRKERQSNLESKQKLLSRLEELVKEEENIGKAFAEFNAIGEEWKTIGHVPRDNHKDVLDQYTKLKDDFFYHINIYKALQENDLRINEEAKRAIIDKARPAVEMESVREADTLIRECQKEWMDVGPTPRDNYKELADEFFGICREVLGKVKEHFDAIREVHDENLVLKESLVKRVAEISELEIVNHGTWTKKTKEILEAQKEWKSIGFARKEDNERVWQEFRTACDSFFDKKSAYYEERKGEQEGNKEEKEKLVIEAEALKGNSDWKTTTEELIKLQKRWKDVGAAPQRDEQRLWQKFRAACDEFFKAKQKNFEKVDAIQEENYRLKMQLIDEVKAFVLTDNRNTDLEKLREFSSRWGSIGFVPKAKINSVITQYNTAIDAHYEKLNMKREEKKMNSYKKRVDTIKSGSDSGRQIKQEKYLLKDKVQRLQEKVRQYEANIELFTGSGAAALRKDIERQIDAAYKEIDEIEKKLEMIED
jgi:hypothetical protein